MKALKLDAYIARTAHDLDHVNRLRAPAFGVESLTVKFGSGNSKSHLIPGAPPPKKDVGGKDDFHFAPETEKGEIRYVIDDPGACIDEAKLEIYSRYEKDPLWTLDLMKLGADWVRHGEHIVKWDGRVVKQPAAEQSGTVEGKAMKHDLMALAPEAKPGPFPDGYVNLKHTTYKLRLTVSGAGRPGWSGVAETYFHILVQKLELEYGPKEVLPTPTVGKGDHRKVLQALLADNAKPPAETAAKAQKVVLESDIYKTSAAEMFSNKLYDEFKSLWDEGPLIPLFVKVKILDSADKGVDAHKAIGEVKFLWDWESKSVDLASGKHADGFVNKALDYHKATKGPKGKNCHKDRGGKRLTGDNAVFPTQAGYDPKDTLDDGKFPFKVEAVPDKRKWSSFSYAWRTKKLAGKTGVLFQPARQAGDVYTVTVYLAWDITDKKKPKLDKDDDAPLDVPKPKQTKVATGKWEIWRRTHLRKYLKKRAAGVPNLGIANITGEYTDAFMEIKNVGGATKTVAANTWKTGVTNAISGWGAINKLWVDPAIDQHSFGPEGVKFRTRTQFIKAWKNKAIKDALVGAGVPNGHATAIANACDAGASSAAAETTAKTTAQGQGYNAADQTTIGNHVKGRWDYVQNYMDNAGNNLNTASKYAHRLEDEAVSILKKLFDTQFDAGNGVTIFQTERSHDQSNLQTNGVLLGLAHDFTNANRNRCGFLLMSKTNDVACGNDKVSAHEIGHHFFLPHPTDTAEKQDYKAHDKVVPSKCLMSYNFNLSMDLCGLCQLRLRGWDKSKLDPDGSKNKKP